jgi:hypothetical protein
MLRNSPGGLALGEARTQRRESARITALACGLILAAKRASGRVSEGVHMSLSVTRGHCSKMGFDRGRTRLCGNVAEVAHGQV